MFSNHPEYDYLTEHTVNECMTQTRAFKHVWFTCINLDKFNLSIDQLQTNLDKWCYFLKYPVGDGLYDINKIIGDDEIFRRAYKQLESYNMSSDQKTEYQMSVITDIKADCLRGSGKIEGKAEGKAEIEKLKAEKAEEEARRKEEEARIKKTSTECLKRKHFL